MKANTYNDGSVSVIIPLYNHKRYVGHALESVFAQSGQPLEMIVFDGVGGAGSTAGTHPPRRDWLVSPDRILSIAVVLNLSTFELASGHSDMDVIRSTSTSRIRVYALGTLDWMATCLEWLHSLYND